MKLQHIGEFSLIARLVEKFKQSEQVLIGPGDDAALVAAPDGDVLVTTDILVEGLHFRRDWMTPIEIGRRVAAQNLADIAAMGGVPTAVVVSVVLPDDTELSWVESLAVGMAAEVESVGASVVGGDVSGGERVVISMTVLGARNGVQAVRRNGAQIGDRLAVAGDLGWSAAGLACLQLGHGSPRQFVERFRVPTPPYAAGPIAARAGASAMIDTSDGLLADAGHIAQASRVAIDLDPDALNPSGALAELGRNLGLDALEWVLAGGEDHCMLATFPGNRPLPAEFRQIGRVVAGEPGAVTLGGQIPAVSQRGHDHFG